MNRYVPYLIVLFFFFSCEVNNSDKEIEADTIPPQSESEILSLEKSIQITNSVQIDTLGSTIFIDSSDLIITSDDLTVVREIRRIPLRWQNRGRYKITNSYLQIMSNFNVILHLKYNSEVCSDNIHFDFNIKDRVSGKPLGEIYYRFNLQCGGWRTETHHPNRITTKDKRIFNAIHTKANSHYSGYKDCPQCK